MKRTQFVPKKITEFGNIEFFVPFLQLKITLNKIQFAISLALIFSIVVFYKPSNLIFYVIAMFISLLLSYYITKDNQHSKNRMQIVFLINYLTRDKTVYKFTQLDSKLKDIEIQKILEQQ